MKNFIIKEKSILQQEITNPHQIIPIYYPWAREYYRCGISNTWVPEEIPMHADVDQWNTPGILSDDEKRLIEWNLGFFSTAESLTANNIVLAVFRYISNPECRQYLLRQAFEEAVHTDTFIYCCESLLLDPNKIYTAYQSVESIKKKDDFVIKLTESILDSNFKINSIQDVQSLIKNLIGFYVIMEGIFFYAGFAMMLSLKREQKMVGIGQQFEYIMRDESIHLAFGNDLIMAIISEYPDAWNEEFRNDIVLTIKEAVSLEEGYIDDALPNGFFLYRSWQFKEYIQYIADKRLERLGLPRLFFVENPFPWMSQSIDLSKEKNFFETRVTEYQTGSLEW